MSVQRKQLGQKVVLGALFVCIISLIFFSYFNYRESEEKVTFLENEKVLIVEDLQLMKSDFDSLTINNEFYRTEINKTSSRIANLLDSIRTMKVDYSLLHRYRKELIILRKENKRLHGITDSINKQNILLTKEIDSTRLRMVELSRYSRALRKANEKLTNISDSIATENIDLSNKVKDEKESAIRITGLEGTAYKVRSNGKVILTNKISRTDRLRACFNISPNTLLQSGEREFYLQFLDPKNNMLGHLKTVNIKGKMLTYSKKIIVDYNNKPLSVCDYIILTGMEETGDYVINIYYQDKLVGSTIFQLK